MGIITRVVTGLVIVIAFNGCMTRYSYHGKGVYDLENAKFTVGKTSKKEIIAIMGSPSIIDAIMPTHMVYLGHKNARKAYLHSKIEKYVAIEFIFDVKTDILRQVKRYSTDDLNDFKIDVENDVIAQKNNKIMQYYLNQEEEKQQKL